MERFTSIASLVFVGVIAIAAAHAAPAREYARVTFREPVKVLTTVLMGEYIIEHDNDRMARGGPCTAIYKASDRQQPVLTFHCKHLKRAAAGRTQVVLRRNSELGQGHTMTEFQFAGSSDSHGVPAR